MRSTKIRRLIGNLEDAAVTRYALFYPSKKEDVTKEDLNRVEKKYRKCRKELIAAITKLENDAESDFKTCLNI